MINELDIALSSMFDQDELPRWMKNARHDTLADGNIFSRIKKLRKDIVIRRNMAGRVGGLLRSGFRVYTRAEFESRVARGEPL